jgi:hypothetical protein
VGHLRDASEQAVLHPLSGQRLPGRGTDEPQGSLGGNHPDLMPRFGEVTEHLTYLVGGDAARDAEHDPPG